MKKGVLYNILLFIVSIIMTFYLGNELFIIYNSKKDAKIDVVSDIKAHPSHDAYDNEGEYYGYYDIFSKMEWHSYLGYIPVSNYKGNGYYTNKQRFRYNENIKHNKPSDEVRIFITGGSTAWGAGVKQNDMYSYVAEKLLNERCNNIEIKVISTGVGSQVSTQEVIRVMNEIRYFEPDVIVMFSGMNDTFSAYRNWHIEKNFDPFNVSHALSKTDILLKHNNSLYNAPPPQKNNFDNIILYSYAMQKYKSNLFRKKEEVANVIINNINIVYDISSYLTADFVFYLQPYLYHTAKTLSDFERLELERNEEMFYKISEYSRNIYDYLYENISTDAFKKGYRFFYADDAIKNETKSVFVDHCHFGDRGNKLIGEHLAKIILTILQTRQGICRD